MHRAILLLLLLLLSPAPLPAADYVPDPVAVQRHGPAYRYPQAGWTILHVEGEPYERGVQHGRLLATEIAAHLRCFAAVLNPKAPTDGWRQTRLLVNALFLRRYDREYLEEMKGIADGATAAGARFDGRPIDLIDIAALNAWPEIETLENAVEALPTGLEGLRPPREMPRAMPAPRPMHCSAFAATGPATKDGKVVIGHITMFGLYPAGFYNVWLDVKPARGHRVLMQSYPGGIQSGLDYYMNEAGLVVCETTIGQTRFEPRGLALASRIRQALQYADSIDGAVSILGGGNNGLYTNEWLLADLKTNEIALFELGTERNRLRRSSKGEWFGGTEGFYWGCNNTKDAEVRLETIPGVSGRPHNLVFRPSERDLTWQRLYREHRGKIDADFGRLAFTTPPLAAYHSLDAKFTTTDLGRELKTWALFGPPLGRTWHPTEEERRKFPEIRPLVSNPWAVLHAGRPTASPSAAVAVDLGPRSEGGRADRDPVHTAPAWHGTLLPKGDADAWLAAAFADYERIVSLERALRERNKGNLTSSDRARLAELLYAHRSNYLAAARTAGDTPLASIRSSVDNDAWYRIASGKGVLLLHELRNLIGPDKFDATLDEFGRVNAGQAVTVAQFQTHVTKADPAVNAAFWEFWLKGTGLPELRLGAVTPGAPEMSVELLRDANSPPARVEVTVEHGDGERTVSPLLAATKGVTVPIAMPAGRKARRVVVDKYRESAYAAGGVFALPAYRSQLNATLIVYGTLDEIAANREAAEALQQAIRASGPNVTVPIKSDAEVNDGDRKSRHLLLIGRPETNRETERCRGALPVAFGRGSFVVDRDTYAHMGSAVLAVGENPANRRFSVAVVAGLSAAATLRAAPTLARAARVEVMVVPNGEEAKAVVLPARELVKEVGP